MSSERCRWQSFLYRALARAQFFAIIIKEHLVVLGCFLAAVTKFQDKFVSVRQKTTSVAETKSQIC